MSDLSALLDDVETSVAVQALSPSSVKLAERVIKAALDAARAAIERASGTVLGAIEEAPLEWAEGKLADAADAYIEAWAARMRSKFGTPPLDHPSKPLHVEQDEMLAWNAQDPKVRDEEVKEADREE